MADVQAKRCSICEEYKPFEDFSKSKSGSFGLYAYCKPCAKDRKKKYREDPKVKAHESAYRKSNVEANRAKSKRYYYRHQDKIREYYSENRESIKEKQRVYREENRVATNARAADWRRRNPHKAALYNNSRRSGYITDRAVTKVSLRERYGESCMVCGTTMHFDSTRQYDSDFATIEHIVPVSAGGPHAYCNCVLVCRRCNLSKGNKTLLEFLLYRVGLVASG